jgi:hypothetical protein
LLSQINPFELASGNCWLAPSEIQHGFCIKARQLLMAELKHTGGNLTGDGHGVSSAFAGSMIELLGRDHFPCCRRRRVHNIPATDA